MKRIYRSELRQITVHFTDRKRNEKPRGQNDYNNIHRKLLRDDNK